MITLAAYDKYEQELESLLRTIRDVAARLTDEQWQIDKSGKASEIWNVISKTSLLDMFLCDVSSENGLNLVMNVREQFDLSYILLMADASVSPMRYLKPGIRANSLLQRPWNEQNEKEVVTEFISAYLDAFHAQSNKEVFVLDSEEGKISVPYEKIYYFEAMDKKIYVCTGREEYGFYGSLEKMEESLPDNFLRCHRGFIVNTDKVRQVLLSQNLLILADDYDVPLSRSYKPVFKEFGKKLITQIG